MGMERTQDVLLQSNTGNIIPFVANTTQNFAINGLSDVYEHFDLFVQLQATLSGYTASPTIYQDAPENLLGTVQLTAAKAMPGGVNETFKQVDGAYLRFMTLLNEGGVDVLRVVPSGGTNGTYAIGTTPRLYFSDPLAKAGGKTQRRGSWLDSRLLASLTLQIGWRDGSAICYGGTGGTCTVTQLAQNGFPSLQIKARTIHGVSNTDASNRVIARQYVRESFQDFPVTSTQLDAQFLNFKVGSILRRIVFRGTVGPQVWGERSDVVLGQNFQRAEGPRFRVRQDGGATMLLDTTYLLQQNANRREYKGVSAWMAGMIVFDADPAHNPANDLDLRAAASLDVWADTQFTAGATNNVRAFYQEIAQTS